MATSNRKQRKKPSKPYPSFPLTAHNNGQWCKKIRGKIHFFGVWEAPQAALDRYHTVAADLHAGRQPKSNLSSGAVTVKEVCNRYLTYQQERAESGEIGHRWFEDCRCVIDVFARFVGPSRIVEDLSPDDFQRFRQKLIRRGLTGKGKGLGVHALNRAITVARGMFKHAYEVDLIDKPIKYGKAFNRPSATLKRKSRKAAELENGKRLFGVAEIRTILDEAPTPLRAMILLGINGGLGNTDCARLPIRSVNLEQGIIEFDRPKTGIERMIPLWPETIEALNQSLEKRPKANDTNSKRLFFLTPSSFPWVREHIHRTENDAVEKVVRVDTIAKEFDELISRLDMKRKGVGFYTLRHTFRTWADEVKDQHAIHRIMGHTIPGMSGIYVEQIGLDRLWAVVNHVREKLFSNENEGSSKE
jgi:integrase